MESTLGARLRAQRERQQVTLEAIAEQSKIRQPLLEALERDDLSHWPGGIFGRSYLRSYAQAIGLDPEATLREFLAVHPDAEDDQAAVAAAASAADGGDGGRRPRMRLRFLIESAVSAIPHSLFSSDHKSEPAKSERAVSRVATPSITASSIAPTDATLTDMPLSDEPSSEAPSNAAPSSITQPPLMPPEPQSVPRPTEPDDLYTDDLPVMNLPAMAAACQRLAQAHALRDIEAALTDAAAAIGADGVVLWIWDGASAALKPSLAHGYSREVLARLPSVRLDADNAIASAFRSGATRIVEGSRASTGAVVVPLIAPEAAVGALAFEFGRGAERDERITALATILAAQLSMLVEPPALPRTATA